MRWVISTAAASFLKKANLGSGSVAATVTKAVAITTAVLPIATAPNRPRLNRRITTVAQNVRHPDDAAKIKDPDRVMATAPAHNEKVTKQANAPNRYFFWFWFGLYRRGSLRSA